MSWQEFLSGKRHRKDVAEFSLHLMDNILDLHYELANKTYVHGSYQPFKISDPKPRHIHKASVRDRLLHHAVYRILYPYFDQQFIFDSYSCRIKKGTHRAMNRFRDFGHSVSRNHTRTAWVLKCDIRQFFASIDHQLLVTILSHHIANADTLWLLTRIIGSFHTEGSSGIGLPLGNLTSQLLVNIFMNEFDQFVKRELRAVHYIRYADDFVILSSNRSELEMLLPKMSSYLEQKMKLKLNPNKVIIKTVASGIDFLGWVHFPDHRVLRTTTRRRILRQMSYNQSHESYQSYLGILRHGNSWKIKQTTMHVKVGIKLSVHYPLLATCH